MLYLKKRKYGLSPEYFLNLKNNILFRSPNNNRNQTSAHNSHMGSNLAKRSKNISNYQHQVQQYQLETKPHANLLGNINANNIQQSNTCNLKNPTFNYNYGNTQYYLIELHFLVLLDLFSHKFPQNLSKKWLKKIAIMCVHFFSFNFNQKRFSSLPIYFIFERFYASHLYIITIRTCCALYLKFFIQLP